MTAYCTTGDLLTGKIPLPAYLDPQKFVDDAADEINSKIGYIYQIPVDLTDPNVQLTAKLVLKRINVHLATGRLLLSVAAPGEQRQEHAYGLGLLKEAQAALMLLADGAVPLEGVLPADGVQPDQVSMPLIANVDQESAVEAFYDRIANPYYIFIPPVTPHYIYAQNRD